MAYPDSPLPINSTKRVRPKTYIAAIYLSLAIALIPVLALVSIFWLRHKVQIDTKSPALKAARAAYLAEEAQAQSQEQATNGSPSPAPARPVTPVPSVPAPAPLRPNLGPARLPVPAALQVADLVRQGLAYLQSGQYDLARVTLLQAENIDPRDLPTLRAQAELGEAERDWDRASGYWKKVVDLSTSPTDATAAQQRLDAIPALRARPVPPPAAVPAPTAPANVATSATPVPATGPVFRVGAPEMTPPAAAAVAAGDFVLRIPIAPAAPDLDIEPGRVGIKLYFYDQVKDGVIVPTNAKLNVAFESARPDWHNRTEVLRAAYHREGATTPSGQRYYGFVFRLYYDGRLVDERSEPKSLLALFPSPS